MRISAIFAAMALASVTIGPTAAESGISAINAGANPGQPSMRVELDASSLPQDGLLHSRVELPVSGQSATMALVYPKWIPGTHAPGGPVQNVGGLRFMAANGAALPWQRDPRDAWRFVVAVPAGSATIAAAITYIANQPNENSVGVDTLVEGEVAAVNWNCALLYPEGADPAQLACVGSVIMASGWEWASAMVAEPSATSVPVGASVTSTIVHFQPLSLNEVMDRPLLLGRRLSRVRLHAADQNGPEVILAVGGARPNLRLSDERWTTALRRLPPEAFAMFGGAWFDRYHVLLMIAQRNPHGLEHATSSLNGYEPEEADWDGNGGKGLIPHEFVHAWVGKARRPAAMRTADFQPAPDHGLLWVYEGLTTYLGMVLETRTRLQSADDFGWSMTRLTAMHAAMPGRNWRSIRDTCVAGWQLRAHSPNHAELRRSQDYYTEGALFWLATDIRLRVLSHDRFGLDDLCRSFFGPTGDRRPGFDQDQLIAALNALAPDDWTARIQAAIDRPGPLDTAGIFAGSGWEYRTDLLTSDDQVPSPDRVWQELLSGIGIYLNGNLVTRVEARSPAARAGLRTNDQILTIGGRDPESDPTAVVRAVIDASATAAAKTVVASATASAAVSASVSAAASTTATFAAGLEIPGLIAEPGPGRIAVNLKRDGRILQ